MIAPVFIPVPVHYVAINITIPSLVQTDLGHATFSASDPTTGIATITSGGSLGTAIFTPSMAGQWLWLSGELGGYQAQIQVVNSATDLSVFGTGLGVTGVNEVVVQSMEFGDNSFAPILVAAPDNSHQIVVTSWTFNGNTGTAGGDNLQSAITTSVSTGVLTAPVHSYNDMGIFACVAGEALAYNHRFLYPGSGQLSGQLTYIIVPASPSLRLLETGAARLLESTF